MTNFSSSKLKEFADDNFKFDENERKLSKQVENTVGKGEIARNEQFLLFPQCFQKACFLGASKGVIVWEWVKAANSMQWKSNICVMHFFFTLIISYGERYRAITVLLSIIRSNFTTSQKKRQIIILENGR